jgi:hypothetical protein
LTWRHADGFADPVSQLPRVGEGRDIGVVPAHEFLGQRERQPRVHVIVAKYLTMFGAYFQDPGAERYA